MYKDNQFPENPIENPVVGLYKNVKQITNPVIIEIPDYYEGIRTGAWDNYVIPYRNMPEDTKEQDEAKKLAKLELPNVTGSGFATGKRKDKELEIRNGRIVIDFDKLKINAKGKETGCIKPGELNHIRSLLCADEYTESCSVTVGGEGLCVFVKIDPFLFSESFLALEKYYYNKFGLKIDPSCKNISRIRFVSSDSDIFINMDSATFTIGRDYVGYVKRVTKKMIEDAAKGEVHNTLIRASRLMGGYIAGSLIAEDEGRDHLIQLISAKDGVVDMEVEKKKIGDGIANGKLQPIHAEALREAEVVNDKKDEIIKEIYSYVNGRNRAGHKWTDGDVVIIAEKYCQDVPISKADVQRMFRRIYEDNKDEFGIDEKPDIYKVEVYLRKRYEFMLNEVTQGVMYKLRNSRKWNELNEDSLSRELQHLNFNFPITKLSSLLKSDFVPSIDPFREYFDRLPDWDYEVDYIGQLADYICTDDQEFFKTQFRKMLVRCVGCGCYAVENRMVFVLVQKAEETGKSSFIRFLNPFGDDYYTEASIRDNKDSAFAFAENFIYNIEELDELSKYDINKLKAMISINTIKERKPYAKTATKQKRRCNFFASTNKMEFLTEDINSRWLCVNVEAIDWGYKSVIDIDKVWGQAKALWHDKDFNCQLTKEEKQMRFDRNRDYQVNTLEKDLIKRLFRVCEPIEGEFMTNADLLQALNLHWTGRGVLNSQSLGRAMNQLGFVGVQKRLNGHPVRGYWVDKNTATYQFLNESNQTVDQKVEKLPENENDFIEKSSTVSEKRPRGPKLF